MRMHHKGLPALAIALALCLYPASWLGAQAISRPRALYSLSTSHFTIIFPAESRSAAEYLASFAEESLADICDALDTEFPGRIPVVISPDSQSFNGYFSNYYGPHIVLYQASISPNTGLARFANDFKKLFYHELTHAVSLSIRSPFLGFLASVFGEALLPSEIVASPTFLEGVTVSFESRDGLGRARQTDYVSRIQEDILENRFPSLAEASGARHGYPSGSYYYYGGCFSLYIQERYGMEKYAALWHSMGELKTIEPFLWFSGSFKKIYGFSLETAWNDFREDMRPRFEISPSIQVVDDSLDSWNFLAAGAGKIYQAKSGGIYSRDPVDGKEIRLSQANAKINRIWVAGDGQSILVSDYRCEGPMPKLMVRRLNLKSRRWESPKLPAKLMEACDTIDGQAILAVRMRGFTQDIVLVRDGKETCLFEGSERLVASMPCPMEDGSLYFLLKVDGRVCLARMASLSEPPMILDLGAAGPIDLKQLSGDGRQLRFAYTGPKGFPRLGRLDRDGRLWLQAIDLQGGVGFPVQLAQDDYYIGSFSRGQRLLRYPKSDPRLEPIECASSWVGLDPGPLEPAPEVAPRQNPRRYYGLAQVLVPQLRLPILGFNERRELGSLLPSLSSAGLWCLSVDPTERNSLDYSLAYDWGNRFLGASLNYELKSFPCSFSLSLSDGLNAPDDYQLERHISLGLGLNGDLSLLPISRGLSWSLGAKAELYSGGPADRGIASTSPYSWSYASSQLAGNLSLGYSDIASRPFSIQGERGFLAALYLDSCINPIALSLPPSIASARLGLRLPLANLSLDAWAALPLESSVSFDLQGPYSDRLSQYLSSFPYPVLAEYSKAAADPSPYYAQYELAAGYRFSTDTQIGDVYVQSLFTRLGLRQAFLNDKAYSSVFAIVALGLVPARGPLTASLRLDTGLEIDYVLPPPSSPLSSGFSLGYYLSY